MLILLSPNILKIFRHLREKILYQATPRHSPKKKKATQIGFPKDVFSSWRPPTDAVIFPSKKCRVSPLQPPPKSFGKILPHQSTTSGAWSNTTKANTSPSSGATLDNSLIFHWGWNFTSVEMSKCQEKICHCFLKPPVYFLSHVMTFLK